MTPDGTLELVSTSHATDGAWLAAADIASIADDIGADYRLIGGNSVTLRTHFHGVSRQVPERETADADMGVTLQVCGDPALVIALANRSYERLDGSRFVRTRDKRELAIDILAPSYEGRMISNQAQGDLVVDTVPGLGLALAMQPTLLDVTVNLLGGNRIAFQLALPDVRAAGFDHNDWPEFREAREGGQYLKSFFGRAGSPGAAKASADRGTQARIRALVAALVP